MTRTSTWNMIGTEAHTNDYKELLAEADLNYQAVTEDLFIEHEGTKIMVPNRKVVLRDDTKEIFGIVSDKYQLCQNEDALDFVECIDGIQLQRAGGIGGMTWMIGKLPEVTVLGDTISPNLIFQNSHDGSCSIKTTICMLRIVCQNQFVAAFGNSPATINIRHSGDLDEKLLVARETMTRVYDYVKEYDSKAHTLATQRVSPKTLDKIIEEYFKIPEEASARTTDSILMRRERFMDAYQADDNQNFTGTKWGVINAFSDLVTHEEYSRKTAGWETSRFLWSLNPAPMNNFISLVEAA